MSESEPASPFIWVLGPVCDSAYPKCSVSSTEYNINTFTEQSTMTPRFLSWSLATHFKHLHNTFKWRILYCSIALNFIHTLNHFLPSYAISLCSNPCSSSSLLEKVTVATNNIPLGTRIFFFFFADCHKNLLPLKFFRCLTWGWIPRSVSTLLQGKI